MMKKFLFAMAMMLTFSVCSFAEESEASNVANVEKYDFKVNHRRLACVLDMSDDQMEMSGDVMGELERDMMFAACMDNEESRAKIADNSIKKNVKYMRYILNDTQYKKYLMLLNLTLKNKGFEVK